MTFKKIIDISITKGFEIIDHPYCNILKYKRKDDIQVEIIFPTDELYETLTENVNIDWEYKLIDDKTKQIIYKDWFDIYGGTAKDKILDCQEQVLEFINNISTKEIRIKEKSVFPIFGIKLLKFKSLQFKKENEERWEDDM